jgi:hypothetical protein
MKKKISLKSKTTDVTLHAPPDHGNYVMQVSKDGKRWRSLKGNTHRAKVNERYFYRIKPIPQTWTDYQYLKLI